jgi:hypothetical protein
MSGYDGEYDDDDQLDGPKALREALKAEKAARKEAEKALNELRTRDRQRTVSDVLKSKGASPALSRFVLADVEDVDEKAVDKWLEENGELFGYEPSNPGEVADGVTEEEAEELKKVSNLERSGSVSTKEDDLMVKIQNAKDATELQAILHAQRV